MLTFDTFWRVFFHTNTKLNFRPYVVFNKRWACAGGAGAEPPATPSVRCGERRWVHTLSTHLLERRYEVMEGFLSFISDSTENMTISQRTSISVLTCTTPNDCDIKKISHDCPIT